MPTQLVTPNPQARQARRALARTNTPVQTIPARSPFHGYVPDIDPGKLGANACSDVENLVARFDSGGRGEVLTHPPGFNEVDGTFVNALGNGRLGDHANTTNDILLLGFFGRTDSSGDRTGEWDFTPLAISAGDGITAGSAQLYRIRPSTGVWQEVTHSGDVDSVAMTAAYPSLTNGNQLMDWAVYPAGASPRTNLTGPGTEGALAEPIFVWCNDRDPVMVYPVGANDAAMENGNYEILTDVFGAGAAGFRARSVEAWADRLNFLNTVESGTRYRQRLRRTAIGTGDPDTVNSGSGFIDFREFSEDGLRCESLGNLLACYFGDGVALVRRSGNSIAPYERQILTTKRGLLSTHSVVNLGGGTHFGLFTDGWYYMDSAGRFQEAGVAEIDGIRVNKWKDTFFNRLDMDLRDRIQLYYDQVNNWVHMTLPLDGSASDRNEEVWIYDLKGDRVWTRTIPVTYMAQVNVQLQTATTIGNLPGTIGGLTGTIGSYGARFGVKTTVHGTHNGRVMQHNPDLTSEVDTESTNAVEPSYKYRTVLSNVGSPRDLVTAQELFMEYVETGGGDPVFTVFSDTTGGSEGGTVNLPAIATGDLNTISRGFRFTDTHLGFEVTGQGPVKIRAFDIDVLGYTVRPRT